MRLDAFKKSVETSKNARLNRFQERRSESQKLSDQLRSQEMSEDLKEAVKRNYYEQTDKFYRAARQEVTIQDFDLLKVIGTGAFGIVRLCRHKGTGDIRAMKQMSKKEMVYKNQVHHVQAERDALCAAKDDWVAGLHYTFQDDSFLYMVMDYLPGGDLMTHLTRKDTFTEDMAAIWDILEGARSPSGLLMVKVREMAEGTFRGFSTPEEDVQKFAKQYKLDVQASAKLAEVLSKRQDPKGDMEKIGKHLERSNKPSALMMLMLKELRLGNPVPECSHAPAIGSKIHNRELEREKREKRSRSRRDRDRRSRDRDRRDRDRDRRRSSERQRERSRDRRR